MPCNYHAWRWYTHLHMIGRNEVYNIIVDIQCCSCTTRWSTIVKLVADTKYKDNSCTVPIVVGLSHMTWLLLPWLPCLTTFSFLRYHTINGVIHLIYSAFESCIYAQRIGMSFLYYTAHNTRLLCNSSHVYYLALFGLAIASPITGLYWHAMMSTLVDTHIAV